MTSQESLPHFGHPAPGMKRLNSKSVLIALAVCLGLQVTSFVLILPLFAQRFSELGAGVEALGTSEMAYALAATLAAPLMGALADRYGRRPLMLISLAAYVLAFSGYRFVGSAPALILLRGLAGAFTAGLYPAVYGMVGDLAPADERARWFGIVNGGQSIGWVVGPLIGGLIFDRFGFNVSVTVSILIAVATFAVALLTIRESRKAADSKSIELLKQKNSTAISESFLARFRKSLPKGLAAFGLLLGIYFVVMFAWAFIEPKFMFHAYDNLGWSALMLGTAMSYYGIAMAVGEFTLSRLSDRWGRKPVIILGLALFTAQFIGLAFSQSYAVIAIAFAIAGLGNAIYDPALNASLLDMAPAEHQSRIMGLKSTAGSLGTILGPGLIVLFSQALSAKSVFVAATGAVWLMILAVLVAHKGSKDSTESRESLAMEPKIS